MTDTDRPFNFLRVNRREAKPRTRGLTEIRGPYYTPLGKRYLRDILETMGRYVDALKFAGGSFSLMPRAAVSRLIEICHAHQVLVSTGGFIEYVLGQGVEALASGVASRRSKKRVEFRQLQMRSNVGLGCTIQAGGCHGGNCPAGRVLLY